MKKFFALALAAAMIASMSAVSLAATGTVATGSDGSPTIKSDEKKVFYPIVDAIGPFTYDADDKALNDDVVEYGDTAYFMLLQGNDGTSAAKANNGKTLGSSYDIELVTESETVSSLKLKADWEEGKSLVKTVSVVKKKVCNNTTTATLKDDDGNLYPTMTTLLNKATGAINSYNEDEYYYFIAVATNSSTSTSDADIIGTLTVSKSSHPKVDDLDMDLAINVNWANSYLDSTKDWTLTGDSDPIEAASTMPLSSIPALTTKSTSTLMMIPSSLLTAPARANCWFISIPITTPRLLPSIRLLNSISGMVTALSSTA